MNVNERNEAYKAMMARREPGVEISFLTEDGRALASIAISLKRIADALEVLASPPKKRMDGAAVRNGCE